MLTTTDPATGATTETGLAPTDAEGVAATVAAAAGALSWLADREHRALLLEAMATAVETDKDALIAIARSETGLGVERLTIENGRCALQFRLFAEAVREGSIFETMIDHAAQTPIGPGPDIRRTLVPLGPVAVFGSSNFPFAFSVIGGDVAAAIAAGCPVIAKAHSSHPLTSAASFDALEAARRAVGAPEGTFGIVYGQAAGTLLVKEPGVAAASFTGSLGAAQALIAAIETRDVPIPFYGELSSINPLVVAAGALAERSESIADGLATSVTGSGGQLCTKPGIAFVPAGEAGDGFVAALADRIGAAAPSVLLNKKIATSFGEIRERLLAAGAAPLAAGQDADGAGFTAPATVLQTTAAELDAELAEECFGPLVVVARYDDAGQIDAALRRIPSSLTTTIHLEDGDREFYESLAPAMTATSGRVVFNGFPTGVRVSWAQQHGGPWPATNTQHTSVGVTAVRRFLRPVAFQNAPEWALPVGLRDGDVGAPRRVDGVLTTEA